MGFAPSAAFAHRLQRGDELRPLRHKATELHLARKAAAPVHMSGTDSPTVPPVPQWAIRQANGRIAFAFLNLAAVVVQRRHERLDLFHPGRAQVCDLMAHPGYPARPSAVVHDERPSAAHQIPGRPMASLQSCPRRQWHRFAHACARHQKGPTP
jgi:hypothetical protein